MEEHPEYPSLPSACEIGKCNLGIVSAVLKYHGGIKKIRKIYKEKREGHN